MPEDRAEKRMKLRYDGTCRICGVLLVARTEAIYEQSTRTVRCLECPTVIDETPGLATGSLPLPDAGVAGASARREHERRKSKDEERLREKWGRFGGIAVALSDERRSTRVWEQGAVGEEVLGARLDRLVCDHIAVLHDRRIPRTRANIDHLVVTTGGVWVIDAKRYQDQRPELRIEGGILRPRVQRLFVGGRDRTALVDGVLDQIELVQDVAGSVRVAGVLCFLDAEWPLMGGAFSTRGVQVVGPKRLTKLIRGSTGHGEVVATARLLAERFPSA